VLGEQVTDLTDVRFLLSGERLDHQGDAAGARSPSYGRRPRTRRQALHPYPRGSRARCFSRGMFCAFASATIVRSRGFHVDVAAATAWRRPVNSLMMRVKTLPRLASAAPSYA
jgi:hypothetical protein